MKITTAMKDVMIDKITRSLISKVSLDDFNSIFYELNLHHSKTKLFPYTVFKANSSLLDGVGVDVEDSKLDNSFVLYIEDITSNVVTSFNRGRKLAKVLKNIQLNYGDILPYNLCSPSAIVVLLYLFTDRAMVLSDIKYQVMTSKVYYLKKYILLLLYIDNLRVKDKIDSILIEFLKRDTFNILDIDTGVFTDEE